MAEKKDKNLDTEVIENMDFLMSMEALEEQDSWELLNKEDSDPESFIKLDELSESEEQDDEA